ncbi:DUF4179 domain-containing protein [Dehalobacterium formicoaceticum]|uniref:DUF4179 domain-containing protein n=2 Tax=Dehalobacterium formicoaceticum TaxID=51515 RepID=A0ABT1Y7J7_9FIRM|nr:DUF4179 domain-containing protein [Dehalobacterium formicoaceticum]MCR6546843.1 DUF4179 domain-containing protein [Dehalobacterium formicoaceticum]
MKNFNQFDQRLREKAKAEEIDMPQGFNERIDHLLENLAEAQAEQQIGDNKAYKSRNGRKRSKFSSIAAAAAVILLLPTVIAFTSPQAVNMAEGAISYFNAPKEFKYLSKQAEYEKYNAAVDLCSTDQGISITLNNIAVDDNYINVFYTLESEEPIQLLGDADTPEQWRLGWTAAHFWFKADGRYIEPAAQGETDAYLVDQHTMKGMQRFALLDQLEDNFNLEMYTNWIGNREGQWHIAVNVDKSSVAVAGNTVLPNLKASVTSGWGEKTAEHDITVKKVSISPFGSQIVLSERGENIFYNFAVRDEKGNYLPVIPAGQIASKIFKVDNSFEFIPKTKNMKQVTIIPIMDDGHSQLQFIDQETLLAQLNDGQSVKLAVNDSGSYVLESLKIDQEKMVAVLHQEGAVSVINPEFMPADETGQLLQCAEYVDHEYNRENGEITLTYYWGKDVTQEDLEEIKGFCYWTNYDFQLSEDEAITIDLN